MLVIIRSPSILSEKEYNICLDVFVSEEKTNAEVDDKCALDWKELGDVPPPHLDSLSNCSCFTFRSTSTDVPLTSIITSSISTATIGLALDDLIINDIIFNSNGILIISWNYISSQLPKYYHIQIYNENYQRLIIQRLIDGRQKSIEINISSHLTKLPSTYLICISVRQKKSCRNIVLQSKSLNLIKSEPSFVLSENKQDNEQFIYLLGGILLGAILVCSILIIICYCRLRQYSQQNITSTINSNEKSPKTFYYHPLNIISYPQQQSNNTSECSLHSSIDTTSHLTNDPYHIYQQIPSVHNCQIHSLRTHALV